MTEPLKSERRRSRAPWVILAVATPVFLGTVWLSLVNGTLVQFFTVFAISMIVGYATVGALVASREPSSPIGWLMLVMGLGFLLTGLTDEWVTYAFITHPGAPLGAFAAWVNNWSFLLAFGPAPILIATFPNGEVASRRWRWLPPLAVVVVACGVVSSAFRSGPIDHDLVHIDNPGAIPALDPVWGVLGLIGGIGLLLTAPAAVISLVLRFRRSRGEERQQIRWFAYAALSSVASLAIAMIAGLLPGNAPSEVFFYAFFAILAMGIPAAVAVAVLRYRLYDLDIVIKKAAVFFIVVVLLLLVVSTLVVLVSGPLVGRLQDSPAPLLFLGVLLGLGARPLYRLATSIADRLVYGGRANPYEVLAEFSSRVGGVEATEDVLPRMAAILQQAVGASLARVWLHVGGELRPVAVAPHGAGEAQPIRVSGDVLPDVPGEAAFEVRHQGELLGALSVAMPANDPMNPSKERLARDLAGQAGLVLRNVRLIEELRASRRRIVHAQDERARKLERDIHDGAQQQLVALAVQLRLARTMIERDPEQAGVLIERLAGAAGDALDDLRDLARGIYPPLLADKGLVAAVEAQARKAAMPVEVHASDVGRYSEAVEATVYFCTLEALNNVAKYAQASSVSVDLSRTDGRLLFTIRDDGAGFDAATTARGSGLQGMTDRVEAVGGTIEVESAPGHGTTVRGSVPARG